MREPEEHSLAEVTGSSLQSFVVLLCAAAILVTGFIPHDIFAPGQTATDLLAAARSAADSLLR